MENRLAVESSPRFIAPGFAAFAWLIATMTLWAFAFYEMPGGSPEWLKRAQDVCFGRTASGLPDTYGWFLLILAPLSIFSGLVVALGREIFAELSAVTRQLSGQVIVGAFLALLTVQVVWIGRTITNRISLASISFESLASGALPKNYPRTNSDAPQFELVDQSGAKFSLGQLRGKTVFLSFAFAHCQTVCPVVVRNIREAASKLAPNSAAYVLITLDPWRDTPSSLESLAKSWQIGAAGYVLSGTPEEVQQTLDLYKVPRTKDEKTGDVVHPALIYVVSPEGKLAYSFNNPSVEWLTDAAAILSTSPGVIG